MWVIAVLGGLIVLFFLALCIPVDAVFDWDTSARPMSRLRFVWLFGLVNKELNRGEKKPAGQKKRVEKEKAPREKPKKKASFMSIIRILATKGLTKKVVGLVRDVFRQFKIRKLVVNVKVGLGNPADTGMFCAIVSSIKPFLSLPPQCQISVQPSFQGAMFEGQLHGDLRLQPVRLIVPSLRFAFSPPALRVMKTLVASKRKEKR